jgi:uncharacterized protein YgiM (DUF1202 family)
LQDTEVRSGPSTSFYATSTLKRGDKVKVLGAVPSQPGWLQIEPPAGSYSWVEAKNLKYDVNQRYWRVITPTSIRPGSEMPNFTGPSVELPTKLPQGAIVFARSEVKNAGGESWLAIYPYLGEVRYIPATAVQGGTPTITSPTTWTLAQDSFVKDPYLAEAQKREAAGDRNNAIAYYQQTLNNPNADPNSRSLASNALSRLQQPANGMVQATTTSLSPANSRPGSGINLQTFKAPEWTPYGRLRDIKQKCETGQPLFVLEDAQGRPLAYVTTNPGKSLDSLLGRWITVYGATMFNADSAINMKYVVVTHTAVP